MVIKLYAKPIGAELNAKKKHTEKGKRTELDFIWFGVCLGNKT